MLLQKVFRYICIKIPKRAKKLYSDVVPKAVDEYLSLIEKFSIQKEKDQLSNPVWHIHNGKPPNEKIVMSFSMLLNLVGSSNTDNKKILWKFINRFHKNVNEKSNPILDSLTGHAIKFFKDKLNQIKFIKNQMSKKKALLILADKIEKIKDNTPPEEIQTIVYTVGKRKWL